MAVTSHSGQISILLVGDNNKLFPSEEEQDYDRIALFRSKISQNFLIYGPVNPSTITWTDPINTNTFNNICVNALSIHDLQEQFLLTVSAEKFSDSSSHDKLAQLTKEKGISDIMNNTFVDKLNHKLSVQCLYTKDWRDWAKIITMLPRGSMLYISKILLPTFNLQSSKLYRRTLIQTTEGLEPAPFQI